MSLSLPYGVGHEELTAPPGVHVDILSPAPSAPIEDLEAALGAACREPIGASPLDAMASAETSVAILVSDVTRSGGTATVLPLVVRYLEDLGLPPASITILVARGAHRKLTKEERAFFRAGDLAGTNLAEHDCDNASELSALLLTTHGTPVRTNVALKNADVTILLAPVSFHYFAGFGGGRKLILPGASARSSILANHRLSLVEGKRATLHPRCRAGQLEGNPVHEDMSETVDALRNVFAINFFADDSNKIVFLNAGDPVASHLKACQAYKDKHVVSIGAPYDILILSAGGYPYDINFLQSHKALRHSVDAVREGGTILFYAKCEEGVGSESLEAALRRPKDEFLASAYSEYDLNNQAAVSLHELREKFEIVMFSAMNVDMLLACGIKSCVNGGALLQEALEKDKTKRVAASLRGSSMLAQRAKGEGQ